MLNSAPQRLRIRRHLAGVVLLVLASSLLSGCGAQPPDTSAENPDSATEVTEHAHPHAVRLSSFGGRAFLDQDQASGVILLSVTEPETATGDDTRVELDVETVSGSRRFPMTRIGPGAFQILLADLPEQIADLELLAGDVVITTGDVQWRGEISHDHHVNPAGPSGHPLQIGSHFLTLLTCYCALIVIASLAGGFLPSWVDLTHRRLQFLVSLIAGLMLGIAIFHLLPHSLAELEARRPPRGPHGGTLWESAESNLVVETIAPRIGAAYLFHTYRETPRGLRSVDVEEFVVNWAGAEAGQVRDIDPRRTFQARRPIVVDESAVQPIESIVLATGEKTVRFTPPEALPPAAKLVALCVMGGLLGMFFLIRAFNFHHHGEVDLHADDGCDHDHGPHGHAHAHGEGVHKLGWLGIFVGLATHSLIDGAALAAAMSGDAGKGVAFFGLGTFLAILLHKPLDAVSITTLMAASGWSAAARSVVNVGFSLMCPIGAALFLLGLGQFAGSQPLLVGCGLAVAAGVFLCVSLSDLLPELELHSHDRLWLSLILLLGIGLAYAISSLEPAAAHIH